jgi:hypothetical protein
MRGLRTVIVERKLSPFVRGHINVHGKYSFLLPALVAGLRALRDPGDDDA